MSEEMQTIDNPRTAVKPPNPRFKNATIAFNKLKKNKAAMIGGLMILLFMVVAFIGPYFTPYQPETPDVMNE